MQSNASERLVKMDPVLPPSTRVLRRHLPDFFRKILNSRLPNFETMLRQCYINVKQHLNNFAQRRKQPLHQRFTMSFEQFFNVKERVCINGGQHWKPKVGYCFIFNFGSMLLDTKI